MVQTFLNGKDLDFLRVFMEAWMVSVHISGNKAQLKKSFDLQVGAAKPSVENCYHSWKAIRDKTSALDFMKVWKQNQILSKIHPKPGLEFRWSLIQAITQPNSA